MRTFALSDQGGGLILGSTPLENLRGQLGQGDLGIGGDEGNGAIVVEFDWTGFAGLN